MRKGARRQVPGRFVRVRGTALHVVTDSSDEPGVAADPVWPPLSDPVPAVVFSSGLGGAWYDWDAVVALLAAQTGLADRPPLVRFDRPGLGWSEPCLVPPTAAGEADRMRELIDAVGLGPPRRCVLVAHSMAAFHAEAFARLYPDRIAGLVLVDASAEPDAFPSTAPEQRLRRAKAIGHALRISGTGSLIGPALRHLAIAATSVRQADPVDPTDSAAVLAAGRPLATAFVENAVYPDQAVELLELRCERSFPAVPLRVLAALGSARLERRTVPAGLLALKHEGWRDRQRDLAELSPCGRLIELEDSAHYIPFDRPDAVADAVLDVLAEHRGFQRTR